MSPSEADVAFACVFALVDELARRGMEHACVSPGSRSTPLALALWRHPHVRVHVHLDERASAFFALGVAKASGRPSAVACTSGTAAAELLPAVVEASMSRTPLIALTADRPPELRGVGANQTIDQIGLYGRYAKWFTDAAVPGERPDEPYWREMAREAVHEATRVPPGPVHLNLPFREPLVPGSRAAARISEPEEWMEGSGPELVPEDVDAFVEEVSETERGLLLTGSLRVPAPEVLELAERLAWPLVAEPTSGLRVPGALGAGQPLLSNTGFASSHVPDLVVQIGAAPTARAGLALAAGAGRLMIVDPDHLVADPGHRAERTLRVDPGRLAAGSLERLEVHRPEGWLKEWIEADERARAAMDAFLDGIEEPSELRAARDLAAVVPDGATLVVGSSMPVRDLDAAMAPREGLRVLANRGASGIDGFVSTVLGVAATGVPTFALCGDLSLVHDVGSLLWSARRGQDAVLVVVNNDGGVIFSFLGQRDLPELSDLFTTPHGLDLHAIGAAASAGYTRIERSRDLIPAVERARQAGGVHLVEVPVDRERTVALRLEADEVVDAALRSGA